MKTWMLAAMMVALVACGGPQAANTGSIELAINGPGSTTGTPSRTALVAATLSSQVQSVVVWSDVVAPFGTCQQLGGFFPAPYNTPSFPITDTFTGMEAGCTHVFHAVAYAGLNGTGEELFSADSAPITIQSRQLAGLSMVLQQVPAPGTVTVISPMITSVLFSSTAPEILKPISLAANVTPSPSPTYQWSVSCPGDYTFAPFSAPTSKVTSLTLNQCSGDATVTFSVTDPNVVGAGGSITSTIQFVLHYVPQGVKVDGITLNAWPTVTSIHPSTNAEPLPGGTVSIIAVASDPENDPLDFSWADDCHGSFSGGATLTPTWTAPATAGAVCTLTLTVDEKPGNPTGHNVGHNTGTLKMQVAPAL